MEAEVCSSSTHSPAPDVSPKPERAKLQLSSSPPPNCAICLSDCDNKSFTDRCMHQFCFACLLRWSKVKAECPLCKQPFKSIIHTVRSNSDYEELAIFQTPEDHNHEDISVDFEQHYYLPNLPTATVSHPPRQRRFQYRTTLYLDPHEDIAIQQMLMSHPLTNTLLMPRRRFTRLIGSPRPANSLDFRHAIYQHNWWVNPVSTADVSGRYRECSPQFYRDNPAQRNRIGPWLARELNALLNENGPHCLYVMSIINSLLIEYHVTSREFKDRIAPYFGDKTDHFIHEFYNFLRSPYDMIGYDRNLQYTQRIQNIELGSSSSSSDSDSDVQVINTQPVSITISTPPPITFDSNDVIVLSDSDSDDSDVIYREPTPPPVVTITDSEGPDDNEPIVPQSTENDMPTETTNPTEIEYKKENLSDTDSTPSNVDKTITENNDAKLTTSTTTKIESIDPEATINSDSSMSSSAVSNDIQVKKNRSDSESSYKVDLKFSYKLKLKNNHKARRPKLRKYSSDSSSNDNNTSSSSDTETSNTSQSTNSSIEKKKLKRKRRKSITSNSSGKSDQPTMARRSYTFRKKRRLQTVILTSSDDESEHENVNNNLPSTSFGNNNDNHSSPNSYLKYDDSVVSGASSSSSHPRLRSVVMKPNYTRFYNHSGVYSSSSDDD